MDGIDNNMSTVTLSNTTINSLYDYVCGNAWSTYSNVASPSITWPSTDTIAVSDYGVLSVSGDAEFNGDIKLKGTSLSETLSKIEERLAILRPNEDLESRWEELKLLRQQYRELESEIIEKEKIWSILKK
jgi:hypothetical protein